ncbi:NAD(P)/FAD-dependent oxidoreductase [Actinomycetospora endophytica]|uniref:Pyridine nucleotide-disulfide oxidoreductase domain-containing protein 2 n=1 Tax=Actinomycetospora endophytica TaxID=2291215 RepID=A0ABS8PAR9_9PSEU|nr:NAD(P)/FAD-dependent oxidoreductase [Actinomycetospora endophytica]MCD2195329.1 NAD(P)/FAD-dependent oxidoreductase [Actinomycetospora endophytica]
MDEVFDHIVIGAGHNGLTAAVTLAEAGHHVAVVERLPEPGGLTTALPRVEAAPEHLLHVGAMDDMFMSGTSLAGDLRLADHGLESISLEQPYGWMGEEGETLVLHRDLERTLDEIRYFSPRDARTYAELHRTLDWLVGLQARLGARHPRDLGRLDLLKIAMSAGASRRTRSLLGRMLSSSIFELVADTFSSDAMRGLCAYWCSMFGPANLDGSGLYLVGFAAVHRGAGVQRPRGGMSAMIEALASSVRSRGGEVRCGHGVERIVVDRGRATGVRLDDGSELWARRAVLSSCAPQHTLGPMLDDGVLDPADRIKVSMLPANAANVSLFKIDMAVGGRLSYPRAQAVRARRDDLDLRPTTFMTGTLEDHVAQFHAMNAGRNVSDPPVYLAILSATDPTLAPDGQDVLYMLSNCAARPSAGWDAEKDGYSKAMTAGAERYLDGLDAEIGRVEHSPLDLERVFSLPNGCFFHVDMTPTRLGMNRPAAGLGGYDTPVEGLYLAGSGVHPGGGVSGWPGRLAARHALAAR